MSSKHSQAWRGIAQAALNTTTHSKAKHLPKAQLVSAASALTAEHVAGHSVRTRLRHGPTVTCASNHIAPVRPCSIRHAVPSGGQTLTWSSAYLVSNILRNCQLTLSIYLTQGAYVCRLTMFAQRPSVWCCWLVVSANAWGCVAEKVQSLLSPTDHYI